MTNPFASQFEDFSEATALPPTGLTHDGKPVVELSYSSLNELGTCARKYQLRKQFHQPQWDNDIGIAAIGGTCGHTFIQQLLAGYSIEEASFDFFKLWDFIIEDNESDWNKLYRNFEAHYFTCLKFWKDLALTPDDVAKFVIDGEEVPAIEVKFNLIINNPGNKNVYYYRGALDLVTKNKFTGGYRVRDFKFHRDTKSLENGAEHKYKFDQQLTPYGLIIQHLTKKPVERFDVSYHTAFVDVIDPVIMDYTFTRTMKEVKEWFDNLSLNIAMIESYHGNDVWPRTMRGCEFYMRRCKYYSVCHIEEKEELQEAILGRRPIRENKPFGEWITINLEAG